MIRNNINEKRVIYLYVEKFYTHKKLSKLFKCSQWKIYDILKKYNITANNKKTFRSKNKKDINNIIEMYYDGKTTTEISKLYDCCRDYIRKILKKNGINTSKKVNIDKDILKKLIFEKHYSLEKLCSFFNCCLNTLKRHLKKYDIGKLPTRYEIDMSVGKKKCHFCKKEKCINDFGRKILETGNIAIISICKECVSIKNKIIRKKTKSKNKNKRNIADKNKECSRCHYIGTNFSKCMSNPDGLQYICKKCQSIGFREYSKNNSNKLFESRNRRRERKKLVKNNYSKKCLDITLFVFNNKCFNCGMKDNLSIDHNYPLSRGYGLTIGNAVLLCRSCNSSKKDILPKNFYSKNKLKTLRIKLNKAKKLLKKSI